MTRNEETPVTVERLSDYDPADAKDLGVLNKMMSWELRQPETPITEQLIRDFIEYPDQRAFVVARLATGRIISAETLNLDVSPDMGKLGVGRTATIRFVCTHEDYRRRGIFGKVWVEGLGWCEENGVDDIYLWSSNYPHRQDAWRFYENHGLEKLDTQLFGLKNVKAAFRAERQKRAIES